jgi:type IV secretion system protein VirB8
LILIITLIASIATIAIIVNAREFDPFVIQIDDTTGAAKIVNPTSSEALDANESLAQYFIKKYVTARETYNPVDFDTSARQTIRLLSTSTIFWNYTSYIKNKDVDPTIIYGQKNTTYLTIKSWSKLDKYKYMVRFAIQETTNDKKTFNKLAVIDFGYVPMNLTELERDINPIGFQVKGYRVDDDNS